MRGLIAIAVVFALLPATHGETALDAIKQLPAGQSARIARIEGRGGAPEPDRWYILTQDPAADNGVHEFVVANGEIVASRSISQFADLLKPDEMIGAVPLTIDSDKAAKIAHDYAEANGVAVTGINYELKKDGPDAAPAWTISCLDDKGNKVGVIVVTAGKGNVVSHDGFALEPAPSPTPSAVVRKREPHFDTYAKSDVAAANATPPVDVDETDGHLRHAQKKPQSTIVKTFDDVGRTLHKYLPF